MTHSPTLETERLILRQWRDSDFEPFARLSSDPEVMKYYPDILNKKSSDIFVKRCQSLINKYGWGFWAVELKSNNKFIGFVGLHNPETELPFSPCTEIGWRLAKPYWGYGYATEAAKASLNYAFEKLNLSEVVSFTTPANVKSISVMKKLNMINTFSNFNHPNIADGHALQAHVLYKITNKNWHTKNI